MDTHPLFYVFLHGDAVLIGVFVILLILSVATWAIALTKTLGFFSIRRANRRFLRHFWQHTEHFEDLDALIAQGRGPLAAMTQAGWQAAQRYPQHSNAGMNPQQFAEYLVRAIRQSMDQQQLKLQAGQTLLASVGSLAPFIGLFGTVWGIHNALIELSVLETVSMELVAGPLGEALVATAAGLAAAIPAVAFYNLFNRSQRLLQQDLEAFAHDLHAFILSHQPLTPTTKA